MSEDNPTRCPVCDGPMKDWQHDSTSVWHPIETAPKDGSEFLAYDKRTKLQSVCYANVTKMRGGDFVRIYPTQMDGEMGPSEDEFGYNREDITHWMPLPEGPK